MSAGATSIAYSRGRDKHDAYPEQRTTATWDGFAAGLLADRSAAKGLAYACAPLRANGEGRFHRCQDDVLPRGWIALDCDGSSPESFAALCMRLAEYQGVGWLTASSTRERPRFRAVIGLSREVDRGEGIRLGGEVTRRLVEGLTDVEWDSSTHRGEQPCYLPLDAAESMCWRGEPVDVDAVLKDAPPLKESPGRAARAAAISSRDPVVRALADRKMVKREHGDGKLSVACPFEREHTQPGGESSTAYFLANFGGVPYGRFRCMHRHCEARKQEDFLGALDLDPHKVWREQRGGAMPSGDLSPLASYAGDAAQERAQPKPGNGAAPGAFPGGEAVYRCLSEIESKPIRWVWRGRIAKGKVFMLAEHPGLGKSQAMLNMASIVTTGGSWPVDRTPCERGSVIFLSAEDDAEDTIRPRLEAAGADLKRVFILDAIREKNQDGASTKRPFNLTEDIDRLRDLARKLGDVVLIVIDPVTAYLGRVDSHRNSEVRAVLAPLAEMAAEVGAAVVCVSHLTKAGGTEAMMRVMGSLGFVAAARGAYLVAKDPEDDTRRLFLPMKNNLAEGTGGLAFRVRGRDLGGGIETSCVEWDDCVVSMSADEALVPARDLDERSAPDGNMAWLREFLAQGPKKASEAHEQAEQAGISQKALRTAREKLGIKPYKREYAGGWWWGLEGSEDALDATKAPKVPTENKPASWASSGREGHLGEPSDGGPDIEVF